MQKPPRPEARRLCEALRQAELHRHYVLGLGAFLALTDGELDFLSFSQSLEAGALNGAEMDENVWAVFALNEAEAFGFVEELDSSCDCSSHCSSPV
jgi:hypothetical protein